MADQNGADDCRVGLRSCALARSCCSCCLPLPRPEALCMGGRLCQSISGDRAARRTRWRAGSSLDSLAKQQQAATAATGCRRSPRPRIHSLLLSCCFSGRLAEPIQASVNAGFLVSRHCHSHETHPKHTRTLRARPEQLGQRRLPLRRPLQLCARRAGAARAAAARGRRPAGWPRRLPWRLRRPAARRLRRARHGRPGERGVVFLCCSVCCAEGLGSHKGVGATCVGAHRER